MKFNLIAAVSALVSTISAATYGPCSNVKATVYSDECKTEMKDASRAATYGQSYGNQCLEGYGEY